MRWPTRATAAVRVGDPKLRTQTAQVGKVVTGSNLGYGNSARAQIATLVRFCVAMRLPELRRDSDVPAMDSSYAGYAGIHED